MSSNDSMIFNFNLLKERVLDTLKLTNIDKVMKKIKGSTLCVGSGGSKVVASFSSIVLNHKNKCTCKVLEPRDALYENISAYQNLFVCSYSGNNHGVDILGPLKIKKYLLTYAINEKENYTKLQCNASIDKEMSFISLGATLMPMSVLLSYYLESDCSQLIEEMINATTKKEFEIEDINLPFDLISGQDTLTSEIYLESTFVESGLANILVHHKYDYCHGRSTLAYKQNKNLIYLLSNKKELDELLLNELKNKYRNIIILESNYQNPILDNFYLTLQSLYLTKFLAEKKNIDLSIVDYDKDLCKKLYKYKGEM